MNTQQFKNIIRMMVIVCVVLVAIGSTACTESESLAPLNTQLDGMNDNTSQTNDTTTEISGGEGSITPFPTKIKMGDKKNIVTVPASTYIEIVKLKTNGKAQLLLVDEQNNQIFPSVNLHPGNSYSHTLNLPSESKLRLQINDLDKKTIKIVIEKVLYGSKKITTFVE
jgi:hypothetical protein